MVTHSLAASATPSTVALEGRWGNRAPQRVLTIRCRTMLSAKWQA
ncbi:hypothetical protein [Streptomyces sp. HUCO-GS316]|nr:hypothetical protein [Streptomyces sp. HUCO-GS316]